MAMSELSDAGAALSILKDPFKTDKVLAIRVWGRGDFFGGWRYFGNIEFKNGNTEGEQKFQGKSIADVVKQMEKFLESL